MEGWRSCEGDREEQRVTLSSSIGFANLGADGSSRSEQLWSRGEKRGRWVRWSETRRRCVWKMGTAELKRQYC